MTRDGLDAVGDAGDDRARVTPIIPQSARTRDPARKQRILDAAADLMARYGYNAVSMEDIGGAVGITAPAIYRHYDSKTAVLVAMFDRVIDRLLSEGQELAAAQQSSPGEAMMQLVEGQISFMVHDRNVARVYYMEIANLPEDDRRRLRRKQRLYLEEWVHVLAELRPDLDDSSARTIVHCAIGAIQSTLQHSAGLPEERLRHLLRQSAIAVLTADFD